jgi:predicted enzyme related to lactoylglutathione lyase
MAISHISVVSIPVSDPDRAKAFYRDVLRLEVLADSEFAPGQRWIQLAPAGAQTTISLVTWLDDFRPGALRGLLLDVDDLDGEMAALRGRGLEFEGEVMDTPWGRFAGFQDPDGNRWSLHEQGPDTR